MTRACISSLLVEREETATGGLRGGALKARRPEAENAHWSRALAAEVRVEEAQRPRHWTLARRLTATLVGTALLSGSLALLVHDRALQRGLRRNAEERLARAAKAGDSLVTDHLHQLEVRYRAVVSAPQLRATLALGDAPTSKHLADQLRIEQGASLIAFFAASGALHARSGDAALAGAAERVTEPTLLAAGGRLHAVVPLRVELGGRQDAPGARRRADRRRAARALVRAVRGKAARRGAGADRRRAARDANPRRG